jgi:hypothetical protein
MPDIMASLSLRGGDVVKAMFRPAVFRVSRSPTRSAKVRGGDKPQVKMCTILVKDYYDACGVTGEERIRNCMSNDAPERTACLRVMKISVETAVLLHDGTHRRRSSSGGGEAKNDARARSWLSSAARNAAMIG